MIPGTGTSSFFRELHCLANHSDVGGRSSAVVAFQACVVRGFASADECDEMRAAMAGLIKDWDPTDTAVFRTDKAQEKEQVQIFASRLWCRPSPADTATSMRPRHVV